MSEGVLALCGGLAHSSHDIETNFASFFQKNMIGSAAQREAVAQLQAVMGLSERWTFSLIGANRKMIRYQSCCPPETELHGPAA